MAIKSFKPYTPSRRNMTVSAFDGVDKKAKPVPSLLQTVKKNAGRNSYGRITVRHRGGGNKRKYRIIDFRRDKTVYLHGAAADRAAAVHGEAGMLPHDLFAAIGTLFAENGR